MAGKKQQGAFVQAHYADGGGFLQVVYRRGGSGGADGLLRGTGLYGHPPVWLRHLGANPEGARR